MKSLFTKIDSCSRTAVSSAQVVYSVMSFLSVYLLLRRSAKKKIRATLLFGFNNFMVLLSKLS